MKKLLKSLFVSTLAVAVTACSSVPEPVIAYEKVGRILSVKLMSKEVKPSFIELAAGATLGGLLGYQFGGGSAQYWTTAIGALGGAKIVDEALSEKYKEIHYNIRYMDNSKDTLISKNLSPTVFKNDLVVVYRVDEKYTIDAYGKYSKQRMILLDKMLKNGELE